MRKTLLSFGIACLLAACSGNGYSPVQFEKFDEQVSVTSPDGGVAGMTLTVDIPVGEGEVQNLVAEGIRTIIKESQVEEELKQPVEGPLKDVCKNLADYFQKAITSGEYDPAGALAFDLMVECEHQNEQAVFFHVTDGVFGNGAPSECYKIIRLSDGHLMEDAEIASLPVEDLMKLIQKYGDKDQKDIDEGFLMDNIYFCPSADSCKVLYLYGSHFWNTITVPMSEISCFLTEEGRTLLGVKGGETTKQENAVKEEVTEKTANEEVVKPAEFGRGELGIFNLRGPVKSFKWKYVYGESDTYTFNEDGFWIGKNGQSVKKLYYGGIERDKKGRIVVGHFDYYEEYFTYNEKGIVTNESCDGVSTEKIYNSDGFEVKEVVVYPPEMGADDDAEGETKIFNFTILEVDKYGNWTKRKCRQGIDTRKIEYY